MLKILCIFLTAIIGFAFGIAGMLAGMLLGGNYFSTFEFLNTRGYEATGWLGLIIGAIIGLLIGWQLSKKLKGKAEPG